MINALGYNHIIHYVFNFKEGVTSSIEVKSMDIKGDEIHFKRLGSSINDANIEFHVSRVQRDPET